MRHANMVASVPVETKRTCSAQGTALDDRLREADRGLGEPEEGGAPRSLLLDRPDDRRVRVAEQQGAGPEDVVEVAAAAQVDEPRALAAVDDEGELGGQGVLAEARAGEDRSGSGEQLAGTGLPSLRSSTVISGLPLGAGGSDVSVDPLDTSGLAARRQRRARACPRSGQVPTESADPPFPRRGNRADSRAGGKVLAGTRVASVKTDDVSDGCMSACRGAGRPARRASACFVAD